MFTSSSVVSISLPQKQWHRSHTGPQVELALQRSWTRPQCHMAWNLTIDERQTVQVQARATNRPQNSTIALECNSDACLSANAIKSSIQSYIRSTFRLTFRFKLLTSFQCFRITIIRGFQSMNYFYLNQFLTNGRRRFTYWKPFLDHLALRLPLLTKIHDQGQSETSRPNKSLNSSSQSLFHRQELQNMPQLNLWRLHTL